MISIGGLLGGLGAIGGFFLAPILAIPVAFGIIGGAVLGALAADTVKAILSPDIFEGPSNVAGQSAQNVGVTLNSQGTDLAIPVVYGRRKIGGTRVFITSGGDNNRNLYMILLLCEGPINGVEKVYIDDTLVYDQGLTVHRTTYTVTEGKYANLVRFETMHGEYDQQPSALLLNDGVPSISVVTTFNNLAYVAVKLTYPTITSQAEADSNPWSGGIPKINFQIQGKRVYWCANLDPNTVGHAGDYDTEIRNVGAYSDNPADCLLDYLRNPIYGKGLSNDNINFASFAKNYSKFYTDAQGNLLDVERRHTLNGVIFTDRTLLDNVKTMLQGMRSNLPYSQGRYKLVPEDNGDPVSLWSTTSTPAMLIDHTRILGDMNIECESVSSRYNRIIVTYMGGGVGGNTPTFEPIELTYPTPGSYESDTYLAEDNNRVNEYRVTLEHCTSATTALDMATIMLKKSRFRSKILSFQADSSVAKLDIGDIVQVQYGYDTVNYPGSANTQTSPSGLVINGLFRITHLSLNNDFTFNIICSEHYDNTYGVEPIFTPNNRGITRAPAGSGVIADIYFPSATAVSAAVINSLITGVLVRGSEQIAYLDIQVNYAEDAAKLVLEYKIQGETFFTFWKEVPQLVNSQVNGVDTILNTLEGLQWGRTYVVRATHKNVNNSYGASAEASVVIPSQPSSSAPYNSVTTF